MLRASTTSRQAAAMCSISASSRSSSTKAVKAARALVPHQQRRSCSSRIAAPVVAAAASSSSSPDSSSSSSFESSLNETQANDALIDQLLACKGPKELSQLVAENLLSFDQKFWIRVAARADTADKAGKDRLSSLARTVMQIVEAVVQQTDRQLSTAGESLQAVLAAGADRKTGEWELPLSTEALLRMRAELNRQYEGKRDAKSGALIEGSAPGKPFDEEAFLSNAFSWMRKAADDGKDGLVEILQKALQLYASRALSNSSSSSSSSSSPSSSSSVDPSEEVLSGVIAADEREWDFLLSQALASGGVSAAGFAAAVRRRMEGVALGLPSGSYAQRVQAEFLKEVEERGEEVLSGKKKKNK